MKNNIIVVDSKYSQLFKDYGLKTLTPMEYILEGDKLGEQKNRVYNLASTFGYQENGYYVSLLALARDDRVYPTPKTIQDLKDRRMNKVLSEYLDEIVQNKLKNIKSDQFELSIYFGKNVASRYDKLSWELYRIIQAPMFRVSFEFNGQWHVSKIRLLSMNDISEYHLPFLVETAAAFFFKNKHSKASKEKYFYDLAILVNDEEKFPPSDKKALEFFAKAFKKTGFRVDFIQHKERPNIGLYDAIFIRETTNVTHHTYRMARNAEVERIVIVDDPSSIVKCTNKIFLEQLLDRLDISRPKTEIYDHKKFKKECKGIKLPCVLKEPDSAFSQGVYKASTLEELNARADQLFKETDLILVQEFLPTEFDWRIGVLDGEVIYACKYFMAENHWQIINNDQGAEEGNVECMDPLKVDAVVTKTALKAANAIGRGFYGVDLKQKGEDVYLIEVNDNPSIEHEVEDGFLGEGLYLKIAQYFMKECNKKRGINVAEA